MKKVSIIGLDLAKNVFQLHGAAADGTVLFRKKLSRPQFHRFMAEHPRCLATDAPAEKKVRFTSNILPKCDGYCDLTVSQVRCKHVSCSRTGESTMPGHTSMLHVRVDDQLKAQAAEALAGVGLTISDAVRILLTRVAHEGGLPAGLAADPDAYDAWFRAKVWEALNDARPTLPHADVMAEMRELIEQKRRA